MRNSKFNLTEIMNNRSLRRERDQVDGQITIQDWLEWKEDIRNRLQETSENFIVIGYRLKQMRESRMYEQEGYRSLSEFAGREYNLSRSVVTRLIQINDRFSENGNSMELKAEYRNYGFAKLQEMLYLTDEELEEVTDDMTMREIRAIRTERDEPKPEEEPKSAKAGGDDPKESEPHERKEIASPQQDDDWKEQKPEPKPIEPPPRDAVYREKIGKTMLAEITEGSRRYLILKMRHKYRVENTLILMECFKGRRTGKIVEIKITHMTDDSGGLIPGYCVLGFEGYTEATEEVREEGED
ncbi:MAG TPA: DUF3850 domain-containing protein [Candidatus Eisenbergiella merdavium]|uniref:DUF3850 domain-containing protein n=1 Tax=Candidatus Eisenbergiella merdavium TaxID=2838551 RepID=A0A9D2NIK5_9FIRM|nr:DUF3850 domain-containing protein [Candidatus Eisenbergiella merdavium]